MASEHTVRRAGCVTNHPAFKGKATAEVYTYLEDALATFLDLTHRSEDPGEPVDPLICDIAKTYAARAGQEGVVEAKDGEMQRKWSDQNGGLDIVLLKRIRAYRQVVGVNAAPLV